ncbi:hypothetical protein ALTERO38_50634 [Alteromonas sp. 38]|nr:hypothetical protein ALTER154_80634 [Alteromonas sp. 154]VXB41829.1 hypothetical protein ALTERO38_50634 [Alteromonas sp. 38]
MHCWIKHKAFSTAAFVLPPLASEALKAKRCHRKLLLQLALSLPEYWLMIAGDTLAQHLSLVATVYPVIAVLGLIQP